MTMALGVVLWAVGNGLWWVGWPVAQVVPWWSGFLVLTIAGERLELSRMLRLSVPQQVLFLVAVSLVLAGLRPCNGLCGWCASDRGGNGGAGRVVTAVRHGPAHQTAHRRTTLHGRLCTVRLWMAGPRRSAHVVPCWYRGRAV